LPEYRLACLDDPPPLPAADRGTASLGGCPQLTANHLTASPIFIKEDQGIDFANENGGKRRKK